MKARTLFYMVPALCAAVVALAVLAAVVLSPPDEAPGPAGPHGPSGGPPGPAPALAKRPALGLGGRLPDGDFWLEQFFPEGAEAGTKVHLDRREGGSIYVEIGEARAELVRHDGEGEAETLAGGELPGGAAALRRLVVRRRGGTLEVAGVGTEDLAPGVIFTHPAEAIGGPAGRTGVEAPPGARVLRPPRVQPLGRITFTDDFARAEPGGKWRPSSGRWELSRMAFAENSANAFALRCGVGMAVKPSPLWRRRWRSQRSGLGVLLGAYDNLPRIERITGLSPAEAAGLKEEDIIVEVNGRSAMGSRLWELAHGMRSGRGGKYRLKILRPGERSFRTVTVEPGTYVWGQIRGGVALEGASGAGGSDRGDALVVAGGRHWSDYRAAVSVSADTVSGGMGLAFYLSDAANHWRLEAVSGDPRRAAASEVRLVAVADGAEEVIARRPWRWRPLAWYRLGVEVTGSEAVARLDGTELFRCRLDGAFAGRVGLWAAGPGSFAFDDVEVRSAVADEPVAPKPTVRSVLLREQDMQNWGNPASDWVTMADDGVAWYRFHLPGDVKVWLDEPRYDVLEIGLHAEAGRPGSGCVARLDRAKGAAEVVVDGAPAASGELPGGGAGPVEFSVEAGRLRLRAGGLDLAAPLPEATPSAKADRVWIRGLHNIHEPGAALAASSGGFDCTFQRAPADWLAYGVWDVVNKWICDPRWSWYGGRSDVGLAALWTKRRFSGDVRLDAFMAVMMTSDDQPYERSGDYNLAIACEPGDLSSGYTLVFGGDNCTVTRLYRKGRVVAESRDARAVPPSNVMEIQPKPVLHQRWFHVSVERAGATVICRHDGRRILEYDDPEPLDGGHCCIWTLRNGILVSRAVVSGSRVEPSPTPSWDAEAYTDGWVTNAVGDFPRVVLRPTGGDRRGRKVYRAANPGGVAGGNLFVRLAGLTGAREPGERLRFDFRAPPGTRADLVLRHGDLMPRVRLTGPPDTDGLAPAIAEAEGVAADGEWHTVEVDLASAWRSWWRERGMTARSYRGPLYLGCASNTGYLLAGMGGNGPGAWYEFSAPEVVRPAAGLKSAPGAGPRIVGVERPFALGRGEQVTWRADGAGAGLDLSRIAVRVLGKFLGPDSPGVETDDAAGTVSVDLGRAGLEVPEGVQVELALLGVRDALGRSAVESMTWWTHAAGSDRTGPRLDATVVSRPLAGWYEFESRGERAVSSLDPGSVALAREVRRGAGGGLALRVENMRTASRFGVRLFGGRIDPGLYPRLEFDYAVGPDVPLNLRLDPLGMVTLTDRHSRESAWTRHVRVIGAFDGLVADGRWHRASIDLLGILTRAFPRRGGHAFDGILLADAGWLGNRAGTRMSLDSVHLLPAVSPSGLSMRVRAFDVSGVAACAAVLDSKPDTVPDGAVAVPAAESAPEAKPGLAAARWAPGGGPFCEVRTAEGTADGRGWIHVRARDRAGNWGRTLHLPVIVDSRPPRAAEVTPRPGGTMPSRRLRVRFDESNAVDPAELSLQVVEGDVALHVGPRHMAFDAGKGELLADLGAPDFDGAFKPGEKVAVTLARAADRLGNSLPAPLEWSWTYDPAADAEAPLAPRVRFTADRGRPGAMPIAARGLAEANGFEEVLGEVFAFGGCTVERTSEASAFGAHAALVRPSTPGGLFRVRLRRRYYRAQTFTRLAFDCLAPEGLRLDLEVDLMGVTRTVRLAGSRPGVEYHGASRPLDIGGGWRRFYVDLEAACRDELPRMPLKYGRYIYLVGRLPERGAMHIDNVELVRADWPGGRFEWEMPSDECPGGVGAVRGFSYVYDRMPSTVPPAKVIAAAPGATAPGSVAGSFPPPFSIKGGLWYFHVRAVDGSGNWGPAAHYPVDFGELGGGGPARAVPTAGGKR